MCAGSQEIIMGLNKDIIITNLKEIESLNSRAFTLTKRKKEIIMTRTLKTLALFLMVSTVSFAYAQQDELDDTKKGGGKSTVKDNVKKGSGVKLDGTIKTDGSKPNPARLASHESGAASVDKKEGMTQGKAKKGSFWSRLFGKKDAKNKKEE